MPLKSCLSLTVPKRRGHCTLRLGASGKHQGWSGGKGERGHMSKCLIVFSRGNTGEAR
jgi:hypothetical protein